jgi:hypothetical protein
MFSQRLTPVPGRVTADVYELGREFNDVCVEAAAELTNLGFVEYAGPGPGHGAGSERRYFTFDDHDYAVFVEIREINDAVLVAISGYRRESGFRRWLWRVFRGTTTSPSAPARPFVPQRRR